MEIKPKFDMDQWIKNKKAAGQWQGSDDSDKQYHKPFDPSKPGSNIKKPGQFSKPGTNFNR